jgi:hypothetical protein
MQRKSANQQQRPARESRTWRGLSRRRFFRNAAGTGAGLALGSRIATAHEGEGDEDDSSKAPPRPIPHISTPPGQHVFFPGPVDTDIITSPNTGHDPSIITDFQGVIGEVDLTFSGIGTDLKTGNSAAYNFQADMRFMKGVFVGLDNEEHHGEIGFV